MNFRAFPRLLAIGALLVFGANILAQEGAFSDYKQPDRDRLLFKQSFEGPGFFMPTGGTSAPDVLNFGSTEVIGVGGIQSQVGRGIWTWPPDGDPSNNGTAGFVIQNYLPLGQSDHMPPYYDINFLCFAQPGCPVKYRIDLFNSNGSLSIGTVANGGIVYLHGILEAEFIRCRRTQDLTSAGTPIRPTEIRFVAIQDESNHYPHVGLTYGTNGILYLDNVRVAEPTRLSGMYKVTGGTANNIGLLTFHNSGISFGTATNWIQTLGNVDIVNTFGRKDFGGSTFASNLLYTSMSSGTRQYTLTKPTIALNGRQGTTWIGTGVTGNPVTDRYYGLTNLSLGNNFGSLFRQVTTSVYSHYIRNASSGTVNTSEVSVNLGGEQIVALADINGDGMDDFITRKNGKLFARAMQGFSGSSSAQTSLIGAPGMLNSYGNLTCYTVTDFDNNGFDDLLMQDTNTGDVFTMLCSPFGGELHWIFTLNSNEKLLAATDADNDGFPDIYCKRDVSDTVGNITIRRMKSDGTGVLTYNLLCQYARVTYSPLAVGDVNGDGSADVTFLGNDAPNYSMYNSLVNPLTRNVLGQYWICSAGTPNLRPIYN